jgi:hypothetical protein
MGNTDGQLWTYFEKVAGSNKSHKHAYCKACLNHYIKKIDPDRDVHPIDALQKGELEKAMKSRGTRYFKRC